MYDYPKIMDRLLALPSCTLITTGRTGTDFLQSLLDSHPQVLMFNGHIQFHLFWRSSRCVAASPMHADDFLDEFIGHYIERFKSHYDLEERKNALGVNADQSIDINLHEFKQHALKLLDGRELNSKNTMVAIYAAYAACLGQNLEEKILFFHHQHNVEWIQGYLNDFPDSKIICMTRDPRANFVSGVENWRTYDPSRDHARHLYVYIKRILTDACVLDRFSNPYIVVKLEDLGNEVILQKLCQWMGIEYHVCMKSSTWAGLQWHGDRLSKGRTKAKGFDGQLLKNLWERKLSVSDRYVLNFIMFYRLKHYGYSYKELRPWDSVMVTLCILLPLTYEWRFFSFHYVYERLRSRQYKRIVSNIVYYFLRIGLFYQYFMKTVRREQFNAPFLSEQGLF